MNLQTVLSTTQSFAIDIGTVIIHSNLIQNRRDSLDRYADHISVPNNTCCQMIRQGSEFNILHRNGYFFAHQLFNADPQRHLCIIGQHRHTIRQVILNADILFHRTCSTLHSGNIHRHIDLADIGKILFTTCHLYGLRLALRIHKLISRCRFSGYLYIDRYCLGL